MLKRWPQLNSLLALSLHSLVLLGLLVCCSNSSRGQAVAVHSYRHHDFEDQPPLIARRLSLAPYRGHRSKRQASSSTTTTGKPLTSSSTKSGAPFKSERSTRQPVETTATRRPARTTTKPTRAPALPAHVAPVGVHQRASSGYPANEVARYLESHQALELYDTRAYFAYELFFDSLGVIWNELPRVSERLRFAFLLRTFRDFGWKFACAHHDKPIFDRSNPTEIMDGFELRSVIGGHRRWPLVNEGSQLDRTPDRAASGNLRNANLLAEFFANFSSFIVVNSTRAHLFPLLAASRANAERASELIGDAYREGANQYLETADTSSLGQLVTNFSRFLNESSVMMKRKVREMSYHESSMQDRWPYLDSFKKLWSIKASGYFYDPQLQMEGENCHDHLFLHLGNSERVVKLFTSLMHRVSHLDDLELIKAQLVEKYLSQVIEQFANTMDNFVALAASPRLGERTSEEHLLLGDKLPARPFPENISSHGVDENRLPARCYLAGRRWRLLLVRALDGHAPKYDVIRRFAERVVKLRLDSLGEPNGKGSGGGGSGSSGPKVDRRLGRLCLPRLEMGLRGWSINGEPPVEANSMSAANRFPLGAPIEGLDKEEDPFTSGARLGFRVGATIGYNEKRNTSLEFEAAPDAPSGRRQATRSSRRPLVSGNRGITANEAAQRMRQRVADRSQYLARASYWRGALVGARRALEIACREGYLATLKVSPRAGMLLPLEAGSRLAALKSASFASQAATQAGRQFVNKYLMGRDALDEQTRHQLVELGGTYGSLAGQTIGETLGAFVGREAALEAYRRTLSRGGKVNRAKIYLDEYTAGARAGYDLGLARGAQVALSPSLEPSAPKALQLPHAEFSATISQAFGDIGASKGKQDKSAPKTTARPSAASSSGSRSSLVDEARAASYSSSTVPMDRWQKDLIKPLTSKDIENLHAAHNHTQVSGSFRGKYTVVREVKRGLQSVSHKNDTYDLEVQASGFMMNDVAYLSLRGTIDDANVLHGSLIARDLIKSK